MLQGISRVGVWRDKLSGKGETSSHDSKKETNSLMFYLYHAEDEKYINFLQCCSDLFGFFFCICHFHLFLTYIMQKMKSISIFYNVVVTLLFFLLHMSFSYINVVRAWAC